MRWVAFAFVLLVVLGVWIASILFPELRLVAWAVTSAVVFLIAAVLVVRWLVTRRKAAALEREMTKGTADDPDKRPEIVALRAEMTRAVQALKKHRGGRAGGRAALFGLPWYVIVGPSAAGKTTALERSGLSFVPSTSGGPKIRGTAGTRNCDWWFSHQAILLDTAGRFATEDDDHDEWMAFLGTLQRLRPERPLDGLMVAVAIPEILSASEGEREQLAAKLRARLDEVLQRLEMDLPVYLLLTKADLVAGFVEFWSDLGKPQRAQVWGASFDLDDPRRSELGRAIEAEFDLLAEGLHARVLERLPLERDPERRAKVMQFPLEMNALRGPLTQFVDALCRPDIDEQTPRLRGFYFTSATQVGRPVARVLASMLRGFDPHGRLAASEAPPQEVQSYFLGDVFRSVILPDRIATRSEAGVERRSQRELRAALAILGVVVFALVPAIISYVRNARLAQDVDRAVESLRQADEASLPGTSEDPLEPMLDTLDRIDEEATGFGIPGWFGPRAARELQGPLRKAYLARLHAALRSRVAPELEKDLSSAAKARRLEDPIGSPDDRTPLRTAYERLKLYAALVDPVDHVDLPWTADQLVGVWQKTFAAANSVPAERLRQHVTNYLAGLASGPELRWPSTPLLQDARGRLKDLGVVELPYHWVLRRAYDQPPILASDVADAASLKYLTCPREQVLVRGPYTAVAWQKIGAALDSPDPWPPEALVAPWVVGDVRIPKDEAGVRARVREEYYDSYMAEWLSLLDKCTVRRPADFLDAKEELTALKDPKGFYRTLFTQFSSNVIADAPKKEGLQASAEGWLSKLAASKLDAAASAQPKTLSPVQKSFQPLLAFSGDADDAKKPAPLEKYATILETLRATLETSSDATSADPRAQFMAARQGVEGLFDGVQEPIKSKLSRLLMPPVEGTMKVTEIGRVGSASEEWKKKVWTAWDSKLSRLFPFNRGPGAREAANYEDFRAFFQPDGTLWGFVKGSLANYVEATDAGYVAKPGVNPLGADLLACLSVAQEITDAFFGAGDEGLKISLQVDWSATDVTEAKFWVGEKSTVLPKAQWSPTVKWNGEGVRLEWVQGGRPTQELGRRSFSLFDLFEQLGGLKPVPGGRRGMYVADFPPLTVKARCDGKKDALRADFFTRLHCPAEIQMGTP